METKKKKIRHLTDEELTQVSGGTDSFTGFSSINSNSFNSAICYVIKSESECSSIKDCLWEGGYDNGGRCLSYSDYLESLQPSH